MRLKPVPPAQFSRRERQIMDILYQRGRATAADIHAAMPDRPSYSAVRAKLRVLEEKQQVKHEAEGLRYVFVPTTPREKAKRSAVKHLLDTFFEGSVGKAVTALLDVSAAELSPAELDRLSQMIESAKKQQGAES
jgi:BlaI family penicillinase repressor